MNLAWQLAWRFRGSKQQTGTSFISTSSTIGIALGCLVFIVLLSVMNGFERELKNRVLSVIPHGELWSVNSKGMQNWEDILLQIDADPRVSAVEPYTKATGMLQAGQAMKAIEVVGIDPRYAANSSLRQLIDDATWQRFVDSEAAIILGQGAYQKLDLTDQQKVQLLLPQLSQDLSLKPPKTKWLTIAGTFEIGGEMDNHLAVIKLNLASELIGVDSGAQGVRIRFEDAFEAPTATHELGFSLKQHLYISDWTRTQGHLYQDIQLVRMVVYVALVLVLAVASFNIVSTLVMAVSEKQGEIAMLKTMGASDRLVTSVFVIQGLINGLTGTVVGVVLGVFAALNLADIASFIETVVGSSFLSGDIYFIDFLPSEVKVSEVCLTALTAMLLSGLATIYPARRASRIEPAHALNY